MSFPIEWYARAPIFAEQDQLILAVETTGDDTPSPDRPLRLQGGDYSAYPFLTIQAAIDAAGATRVKPTTINVGLGTFDPFDFVGVVAGDYFKIQGTMGTPVGPFTVTSFDSTEASLTVSGETWTTNEYEGYILEITSGIGAGQKTVVCSNTADTILTSKQIGGIGSVFQVIPHGTIVQGIKPHEGDYQSAGGTFGCVGSFAFWNIYFKANENLASGFAADNSKATKLYFQECRIGDGSINDWGLWATNVNSISMLRIWHHSSEFDFIERFHDWDFRPELLEDSYSADMNFHGVTIFDGIQEMEQFNQIRTESIHFYNMGRFYASSGTKINGFLNIDLGAREFHTSGNGWIRGSYVRANNVHTLDLSNIEVTTSILLERVFNANFTYVTADQLQVNQCHHVRLTFCTLKNSSQCMWVTEGGYIYGSIASDPGEEPSIRLAGWYVDLVPLSDFEGGPKTYLFPSGNIILVLDRG